MWDGIRRCGVAVVVALGCLMVLAPVAGASISPTLTLDQSAGTTAGSTVNLGLTLKFAPSGSDSPDSMSLVLPPGLLANASIDGGSCLTTKDLTDGACQVGNGTVTSDAYGNYPDHGPGDVRPSSSTGSRRPRGACCQQQRHADRRDRRYQGPSVRRSEPASVCAQRSCFPNSLYGVPISITADQQHVRRPALSGDVPVDAGPTSAYRGQLLQRPGRSRQSALRWHVTRCSALPFSPSFSVTAARGTEPVKPVSNRPPRSRRATSDDAEPVDVAQVPGASAVTRPPSRSRAAVPQPRGRRTCTAVGSVHRQPRRCNPRAAHRTGVPDRGGQLGPDADARRSRPHSRSRSSVPSTSGPTRRRSPGCRISR